MNRLSEDCDVCVKMHHRERLHTCDAWLLNCVQFFSGAPAASLFLT